MKGRNNPPHPGDVLAELFLDLEKLNITESAEHLGVSRSTLSQL